MLEGCSVKQTEDFLHSGGANTKPPAEAVYSSATRGRMGSMHEGAAPIQCAKDKGQLDSPSYRTLFRKTAFITPTVCRERSAGATSVGEMTFCETHH